jgi:hypothetical protein
MERSLNRDRLKGPGAGGTVQVTYLDAPRHSPDSLASAAADFVARADIPGALREGAARRVKFLFAVRCPVVCAPDLRAYVRALGPDALVDMVECWRASGKP